MLLREVIGRVVMLQAYAKGWLGARRYKRAREKREKAAIAIQSGMRPSSVWPVLPLSIPLRAGGHSPWAPAFPLLLSPPCLPLLQQTVFKYLHESSLIPGSRDVAKGTLLWSDLKERQTYKPLEHPGVSRETQAV